MRQTDGKLDPYEIDDVIIGCAMPEGSQGLNFARVIENAAVQNEVGDLTIALAEKVVEKSLDDATNRQLIDNYINNLGNN